MNIDINAAKQYNEALKQARNNASQLEAEKKFMETEITNLCNELSAEIGETVTIENAESILQKYAEKIENTVNTGNIVLAKIQSELNNSAQANTVAPQMTVQQQAVEVQPGTPVAPVQTVPPVQPPVQPQVQSVGEVAPQQNMSSQPISPVEGVELPKLFGMG